ncbi:MAG: hypothetical protein EPN37_04485 [Chitinophagaceae bacterium]|nr:MAG: hypothetical protein EPN37_04485 [Chitinophagaceae bacterium]
MDDKDIKIWILTTALILVISVIGFIVKTITRQILKRLDQIVNELKQVTRLSTVHEQQIKSLGDQQANTNMRLNDHAVRLRKLEIQRP